MFESLLEQIVNQTTATPDVYTGFIVAVATLVSAVSGIIVHYVNQPKIKAAAELASATANRVVENKGEIGTLAKVTYGMLPEQAQQIADAPTVRIAALETKLQEATAELAALQGKVQKKIN